MRDEEAHERGGFIADLGRALAVWPAHVALPILSLALVVPSRLAGLLPSESPALGLLGFFLFLVSLPWAGVERAWYLAAWQREEVTGELVRAWWRTFFWPFFRLSFLWGLFLWGLLAALVLLPRFAANMDTALESATLGVQGTGMPFYGSYAALVLGTILMTFIVPAVSYRTRSVWAATKIGVAMLLKTFPSNIPYVLVPALLMLGVMLVSVKSNNVAVLLSASTISSLFGLAFSGAQAKFYLRFEQVVLDPSTWDATTDQEPT